MNCPNCMNFVAEEAAFCPQCGARMDGQPYGMRGGPADVMAAQGMKEFYEYQRAQNRKDRELFNAREAAYYAQAEFVRLKKRRTSCLVAGIIIACFLVGFVGIALASSAEESDVSFLTTVPTFVILGAFSLFAPFGFMPIKDFISNNGAVVVFAWVFIIVAFMLVYIFCVIGGIPCFFHLQSKIKAAERDAAALQNHVENISATL